MNIKTSINRFIHFGQEYGWNTAWGYIVMPYLKKRKALQRKHRAVKDYLWKWSCGLNSEIAELKAINSNIDCPIWVCWLQGEDQMPETIRICYDSVIKNAAGRQVVLLTQENLQEFVEIPSIIEQKRLNGEISLTHYADYLRILLLATYGGLWVDASIYVCNNIDFLPKQKELYTIKFNDDSSPFVSQCRWTVGMLGCASGNSLFQKLELLMRSYIALHNEFIDFFLFDYFIAMLYDHDVSIKNMIDQTKPNNAEFYKLEHISNIPFDPMVWNELKMKQTYLRLSWKSKYISTIDGKQTYYGYLLESAK